MAVDAGVHLAAIIRILDHHLPRATRRIRSESLPKTPTTPRPASLGYKSVPSPGFSSHTTNQTSYFAHIPEPRSTRSGSPFVPIDNSRPKLVLSSGPFADLQFPYESAKANAAYLLRNLISTYLITHPHLDHLAGFAVNTASFQHTSRPKKLAALPSTIDAIKTHIFNDVIWPNLSDEEGGVGLVSYMRLVEGGNVALGEGEGRGYIELCEGLAVKSWSVSHGHCMKRHSHHGGNGGSGLDLGSQQGLYTRSSSSAVDAPRGSQDQGEGHLSHKACVYDSAAFFIRDDVTGKEVLVFGDVEPDSISLFPRTARVWSDAASKVAAGILTGIFIECSYDDSQSDETLFGHLAPRHLIAELQVLAEKVRSIRRPSVTEHPRKRKRESNGVRMHDDFDIRSRQGHTPYQTRRQEGTSSISPSSRPYDESTPAAESTLLPSATDGLALSLLEQQKGSPSTAPSLGFSVEARPLHGLQIIIIHVKDTLKDGPEVGDIILSQLQEHDEAAQLGCTFVISKSGTSIWL